MPETTGGKALKKAIKNVVWSALAEHGFGEFSAFSAYRHGDGWIDVVTFDRTDKYQMPYTDGQGHPVPESFLLYAGTYYTDVHRLPWMPPLPVRPKVDQCQQLLQVAWMKPRRLRAEWILWEVKADQSNLAEVIEDAKGALTGRVADWFERNHDLQTYMLNGLKEAVFEPSEGELLPPDLEERYDKIYTSAPNGEFTQAQWFQMQDIMNEFERRKTPEDHDVHDFTARYRELYGLLLRFGRYDELLAKARESADDDWFANRITELQAFGPQARGMIRSDRRMHERFKSELAQLEHLVAVLRAS